MTAALPTLRALLAVLAIAAAGTGCAKKTDVDGPVLVGLVTGAAGLGDRSFNDAARAGLDACGRELGAQTRILEPGSADGYERQLTLLATENADEVIGVGYGMDDAMNQTAKLFPGRNFAVIGGYVAQPNVQSVQFKVEQGSFLAGALAALISKRHAVAFLGGSDGALLRRYESGFAAGLREIGPQTRLRIAFAGSFDDPEAARRTAETLYAGGADIVFAVAGKSDAGAIAAAKERPGRYVIGVDADQDGLAPGIVLTSMVERVDRAVESVCADAAAHKPGSGRLELGLAERGVGLTDFRYTRRTVGDANIARLARLERAIDEGRIVPPATSAELAAFRPTPLR
jgi:basic membrane protein A